MGEGPLKQASCKIFYSQEKNRGKSREIKWEKKGVEKKKEEKNRGMILVRAIHYEKMICFGGEFS